MSDSLWSLAAPQLRELPTYEIGKPIEETARELGLDPSTIVKLASNENPLGPSPLALEAMREALLHAHLYPDGGGWKLRQALARKHGLGLENIVLGNGSNEIFEFLGRAFFAPGAEVIAAKHAFVVYALMTRLCGATFVEVDDPGFTHDLDAMLAAITPRTRAVIVANPNNPTGTIVPAAALDDFIARVPDHVITVIDEAYYEFLDEPPDTLRHVREGKKNVVLMRTFSKIQGLAALRVGYGMARPALAEVLQKTRQPFNVNAIAQAGALAALADEEHQQRTKTVTDEGRAHLQGEFAAMDLEYVPSFANFILVRVGEGRAAFDALLRRGVIVRPMGGYKLPDWIRVSIGTREENACFLDALRAVLAERGRATAEALA